MNKKPNKYTLYSITCTKTNKVYIGVCSWWSQRKGKHLWDLRKNQHRNIFLQDDFNKHGEDSISFDVIQNYNTKKEAEVVEFYYTNVVFNLNKGYCYNILSGGANIQEQITKINSDKIRNDIEYRGLICDIRRKSQTGKKQTQQCKDKIRDSKIGRKASAETKKKFSEMRKGELSATAKKVINEETGKIYGCLKDATSDLGLNYDTIRARMNGYNKQKTDLRWL